MSGPNAEGLPARQTGRNEPALGEDARRAILNVLVPLYYSEWDDGEEVGKAADDILAALNEPGGPVATLLAQARAAGAAEERERIARVRQLHSPLPDRGTGVHCASCQTHVTFTPYEKCRTLAALDGSS